MAANIPDARELRLTTWLELSHLRAAEVLPAFYEKADIRSDDSTPVYDLNGELLFVRTPVEKGRSVRSYADVAVHPAFGEPLLAVSSGAAWNEKAILKAGHEAARQHGIEVTEETEIRFVAYSFPKIALQFREDGEELGMLELHTWQPVPPSRRESQYEPPSNFERWSYLAELTDEERLEREARFRRRADSARETFARSRINLKVLDSEALIKRIEIDRLVLSSTRELHYSTRNTDHFTCYEVRGQETNVWCVAGSVQMLLDFYRYEYSQVRLAQELGLGTLTNPNGLPYSQDSLVVTVIEKMTCNALNASMNTSPNFGEFVSEINANRPLISFIPGHSRTVAGYTWSFLSLFGLPGFRGLLVYDPWPPNAGVITRWENYNTSTYRRTFTARVCQA